MTRACPLACVHCRAEAQPEPLPGELTTDEARALVDELAACPRPRPILVLTGGDCFTRPDLEEVVAHAHGAGAPVAIAPSVSPLVTRERLRRLGDLGVTHVSLSLDGAVAQTHEQIRQVPGHFAATLEAIDHFVDTGFTVQVNTAVMARNVHELADIAALIKRHRVSVWEVFFLVNVGRGDAVEDVSPDEAEQVCHFLVDASRYGIVVRTVEAPFFRRVQAERAAEAPGTASLEFGPRSGELYRVLALKLAALLGMPTSRMLAPSLATRDGKGIIFVGYDGGVYPAGFLPVPLGNVREAGLLAIYRDHPLLRDIRAARFPGVCGRCEYRDLCGGSRARAYAATGDPLGDDPACALVAAALAA